MLKKYGLIILLLNGLFSFAQKEAYNWYFGDKVALNFAGLDPISLPNSDMLASEGCSTMSDLNGNLLFYTNGVDVWDKNHNIMPNGTGLFGFDSTSQNVSLQKPGSDNIYYVFCMDDISRDNGLHYSEIDMALNGGNGDVTAQKNIQISTKKIAEQITVAKHADGVSFWVIVREADTNNFLSFLVDDQGVSASPILSSVGNVLPNYWGYMKVSPKGDKLALIGIEETQVYVFNLNRATGMLSDMFALSSPLIKNPYGIEFSPDGNKLYVSSSNSISSSGVYQFNLNLEENIISENLKVVYQGQDHIFAMQLAVNGKIYLSNYNTGFLDVINRPNFLGADCSYQNRAISVVSGTCKYGVPAVMHSYVNPIIEVENLCLGNSANFNLNYEQNISAVKWDFGDASTSTELTPEHIYSQSGQYTVNVDVTFLSGETQSASKIIEIFDSPTAETIPDVSWCYNASYDLEQNNDLILGNQSPVKFQVAYFSNLDDLSNHIMEIEQTGKIFLESQTVYAKIFNSQNSSCYAVSEFNIDLYVMPEIEIVNYFICNNISSGSSSNTFLDIDDITKKVLRDQLESDFSIAYYRTESDAMNKTNQIVDTQSISIETEVLYVRLENILSNNCFSVGGINIVSVTIPEELEIRDFILCDDISNDGIETFNLNEKREEILNSLKGDFNFSYHVSETDANIGLRKLEMDYENTSNPQEIFVRIENTQSPDCYNTSSFSLFVQPYPFISKEETLLLCEGEPLELNLSIDEDFQYDSLVWSTGETSASILINQEGVYTVVLTKTSDLNFSSKCTFVKTFNVLSSEKPIIKNIEINGWSSNNSIRVLAEGNGVYEYSIDGKAYTDNNFFTNVKPGNYTIHVKDKNGCGVAKARADVLGFSKFFTPNNDGFNDFWQITPALNPLEYTILIFDRYGKLLKELNPSSQGWDGTFKGRQMPNSDYWFLVKSKQNNEQYSGHFSLKR